MHEASPIDFHKMAMLDIRPWLEPE